MRSLADMVLDFWPQNTLRAAHLIWQARERGLIEAQQRLARDFQAVRRQAERAQIETDQGIMRAARQLLDRPLDPALLQVKGRLHRMFARCGQGFCRRAPAPLALELEHYAAGIEKICRSHEELGAKLRLAAEIIGIFAERPEFCHPPYFRLALTSPESARLLFLLRQKRRQDRRIIQDHLSKIDQTG